MEHFCDPTHFDSILIDYTTNRKDNKVINRLKSFQRRGFLQEMCKIKYNIKVTIKNPQYYHFEHEIVSVVEENRKNTTYIVKMTLLEYITKHFNNIDMINLLIDYSEISNLFIEYLLNYKDVNLVEFLFTKMNNINDYQWINIIKALKYGTEGHGIGADTILPIIRLFIDNGFDINKEYDTFFPTKGYYKTTLLEAILGNYYFGFDNIINYLLDNGADVNYGCSILHLIHRFFAAADQNNNYNSLILKFIENGCDIHKKRIYNYDYIQNKEYTCFEFFKFQYEEFCGVYDHRILKLFLFDIKPTPPTKVFINCSCPICLEKYNNNHIALIPCGHTFCSNCLEMVNGTCPVCRSKYEHHFSLQYE